MGNVMKKILMNRLSNQQKSIWQTSRWVSERTGALYNVQILMVRIIAEREKQNDLQLLFRLSKGV